MSKLRKIGVTEPGGKLFVRLTVGEVLHRSIAVEYKAGEIYKQLSNRFSQIPRVSRFWDGMALDEEGHGVVLKRIYESLEPDQSELPAKMELLENMQRTELFLSKVCLDVIENLDDAYELAHELESSEVNFVFKCLATEFISSEERRKFVLKEIDRHLEKLSEFPQNFGARAWRTQIMCQDTVEIC